MPTPAPPFFVWDGECGFCGKWAGWLQQSLRSDATFVAFQDVDNLGDAGLTEDDVIRASWWVPPEGTPRGGEDGIAAALRSGEPKWAKLGGQILSAPLIRQLARLAYGCIATNRHRLPAPNATPPIRPGHRSVNTSQAEPSTTTAPPSRPPRGIVVRPSLC